MPNWFVALPVDPGPWLEVLNAPDSVRKFVREDVHMTLAFLGESNPSLQNDIIKLMHGIQHQPFILSFNHLLLLPSQKHFSAVSLALDKGREVAETLIASHRGAMYEAAHAKADDRDPLPHITIARPKKKVNALDREEIIEWLNDVELPTTGILVDRVALYTWADDRKERQFKIVEEHHFDGTAI